VIAYRMNALSWQMMRRMKYQPWVGLPNILCQEFVVPERLQGDADPDTLAACDATLVASGTATLEAALFKRPMVIGYKVHWLNARIWRTFGYLPWVGLPNILSREFVVPELLQEACQPAALADALQRQLDDAAGAEQLARRFTDLHHLLRRDTARTATDAIAQVLAARSA
jgi:lipid-A-disaccharide synthase